VRFTAFQTFFESFVFQRVQMLFDGTRDRQWNPDEHRQHELICIGRNLDPEKLKADFLAYTY